MGPDHRSSRWRCCCCQLLASLLGGALWMPLSAGQHSQPQQCTPLQPGCTCQTVALSCDTLHAIRHAVAKKVWGLRVPGATTEELQASSDALKASPARLSRDAGEFVGGVVRLAFHDAAEFDPHSGDSLRADGCIDLANTGNAGLEPIIEAVDELWMPFCSEISRADFWALAAKTAIEESTPYVGSEYGRNVNLAGCDLSTGDGCTHGEQGRRTLLRGDAVLDDFVLPFRYGRIDVPACGVPAAGRLPDSESGPAEIEEKIMSKFGLDARRAVALMGAHTLGRCDVNNSGYNSTWKDRPDLFTTEYYRLLMEGKWRRAAMSTPHTAEQLYQWSHVTKSDRNRDAMMLAADMQLVYGIDPTRRAQQPFAAECGPLDKENRKSAEMRCPATGQVYPHLSFDQYVAEFAEGDTASHDEPGASRWLAAFADAWKNMTEVGYADWELHCPQCPSDACVSCPVDVLCGRGWIYGSNKPSMGNRARVLVAAYALAMARVLA